MMATDDRAEITVYRLTAADLDAVAGRKLTDEELTRLGEALPNSSIPDAVAVVVAAVCEDTPRVPVFFHVMGEFEGEEYGNAVTRDGGDPVAYDLTRAEYDKAFPENLY